MTEVEAIVLIRVAPEKTKEVMDAIKKVEGVKRVDGVTGRFDVIVTVTAPDLSALTNIIIDKIRKVEGVLYTETLLKVI